MRSFFILKRTTDPFNSNVRELSRIVACFVLYEFKTTCLDCISWQDKTAKAMLFNRFGVNVEYLRQGMGARALVEARKIAKSKNAKYIRLTVIDSNIPAINLYK